MPRSTEPRLLDDTARRGLRVALAGLISLGPGWASAQSASPATSASSSTSTVPAAPPSTPASPSTERLIESLAARLQELERREAERANAANTVAQNAAAEAAATIRRLQNRIDELEQKVHTLENGRILPEIALTPDDGPTAVELDQKIRILARQNELAAETAEARAKETPVVSIGAGGLQFRSADTNFAFRVRGLVQADTRHYFGDHPFNTDNDGFLLRRARLSLEGTVFQDFDFQLVPDFGGANIQMLDANVAYRFQPDLRLRAGRFKSPVGYEQYLPVSQIHFNERAFVSALVPVRNNGLQLEGEAWHGQLNFAGGLFTSAGDGRNPGLSEHGDEPEFAGRLFFQPFRHSTNAWLRGLQAGVSGSWSQVSSNAIGLPNNVGGTVPGYLTPGGQQFFAYNSPAGNVVADGAHARLSPFLQYTRGPVGLLAEYIVNRQGVLHAATLRSAELEHTAYQIAAQWVLTGEPASWTGIVPDRPFRLTSGGWGAWQLVGRYSGLDPDANTFPSFANPATSARSAASWAIGLNWWLNRNVRVLTSFSHTSFEGGGVVQPVDPTSVIPPATVNSQDENALLTRLQVAF